MIWKSVLLMATAAWMGSVPIEMAGQEIQLTRGSSIPIAFEMEGNVASLEENDLLMHRTLYIRVGDDLEEILFSLDGVTWKSFEEMFTGKISATGGFKDDNGKLQGSLSVSLNLR